jgi:hypothetical protein
MVKAVVCWQEGGCRRVSPSSVKRVRYPVGSCRVREERSERGKSWTRRRGGVQAMVESVICWQEGGCRRVPPLSLKRVQYPTSSCRGHLRGLAREERGKREGNRGREDEVRLQAMKSAVCYQNP